MVIQPKTHRSRESPLLEKPYVHISLNLIIKRMILLKKIYYECTLKYIHILCVFQYTMLMVKYCLSFLMGDFLSFLMGKVSLFYIPINVNGQM